MKNFLFSKKTYPTIILKKNLLFPTEKLSLVLEGDESLRAIEKSQETDNLIVFLFKNDSEDSRFGTLTKVIQNLSLAPNIQTLIVEGLRRIRILNEFSEGNIKMAEVQDVPVEEIKEEDKTQLEALSRNVLDEFRKLMQAEGLAPIMEPDGLQKEYISPEITSDVVASSLKLDFPEKLKLFETLNVKERLELLSKKLAGEINIAKTEHKIQEEIEKEFGQVQKEFILREKLKAIEKELGIYEEQKEYEELKQKILKAGLPKDAEEKILGEFRRLRQMPAISAETPYIRTYLEWISELPWSKETQASFDIEKARVVLDQDHYGLEKAKERVLEYLAVEKLTDGKGRGTILCFVGPPGTGKTSVGQSIARALSRKFVRISLGGIRDEAEIRGHRRTYVGALPGRIIMGIRNASSKNPVFMMDEIDKIGADFRGDPSAALLEVLDPAQNSSFSDHYIEIPFDLSEVFFITTANILDTIPPALKDRMEIIEFPGYTEDEKFNIAKKFLVPRVLKSHGLSNNQLAIENKAIHKIINLYTREAGVRDLERKFSEIARKIALKEATLGQKKKDNKTVTITESNLFNYLGPEEFEVTFAQQADEVGVATGLAWTPSGGEIIFIEANIVPGKGHLTLTGQLGGVMQESARAALSYVRSRSKALGFSDDLYYKSDIHIHVPSGAIPKDGPSAGIAIATALASMFTKKKVRKEVALTGEVTLSGKVLKVGGIKEKILAAHRGGVRTIVVPAENEKNLIDVPEETRKELKFKFVKHMDEVVKYIFV